MNPSARIRWAVALGVAALVALIAVVGLLRRPAPPAAPAPPEPVAAAPESPPAAAETPKVALGRSDLLAAAAEAASAYAAGRPYPAAVRSLVGQRFDLQIAFGCTGPAAAGGAEPAAWSLDPKDGTLRLKAQPRIWTDTPWVRDLAGTTEVDSIEGFWIPRPWAADDGCPAPRTPAPGAAPPTLSEPSVGLVQVFRPDDSRLQQRGERPFQTVRKASEADLTAGAREFRLALAGRVTGFPGGDAVRCDAASVDQRPTCLIGVEIAKVAFVDPKTREVLASW